MRAINEWNHADTLPAIVRDRLVKPFILGAVLLLIMLAFLFHRDTDAVLLILLLTAAMFVNMADFYHQYRAGKILIFEGECLSLEKEETTFKTAKTYYWIELRPLVHQGEPGEEKEASFVYLTHTKQLTLHQGEVYQFAFWNREEISDRTLIAHLLISNRPNEVLER